MPTLAFRGEHITLAQALKLAGLAESGGQAKRPGRGGTIRGNGRGDAKQKVKAARRTHAHNLRGKSYYTGRPVKGASSWLGQGITCPPCGGSLR
jgi:ribosome-associated protein YbcJ (S4-like RNA binding protein)